MSDPLKLAVCSKQVATRSCRCTYFYHFLSMDFQSLNRDLKAKDLAIREKWAIRDTSFKSPQAMASPCKKQPKTDAADAGRGISRALHG